MERSSGYSDVRFYKTDEEREICAHLSRLYSKFGWHDLTNSLAVKWLHEWRSEVESVVRKPE